MDAVLGLSMTPTTVGLVLVEGQDADGATMDRDAFDVSSRGRGDAAEACERAAAAVRRSEAVAATRGHRLHSIGVTWSEEADVAASLLLKSLTDSGFDNVVPVRLPAATEALARGIADVLGYPTTAVCVIEPESVIALIVHAGDGAVQTGVNHAVETEEDLVRWLSTVFTMADWQPDALVVVGSAGDLDDLVPPLQEALSVPVLTPAEAELALARGAALASTHTAEFSFDEAAYVQLADRTAGNRRARLSRLAPMAMLATGAVTFVVSVSLAVTLQMPARDGRLADPRPAAITVQTPAAVQHLSPPVPQAPVAEPPAAPPVEAAIDVAPPADLPAPPPEAPPVDEVVPVAVPDAAPPPPADITPVIPEVSGAKPPLLTRILGRIPGIQRGEVPPAPQAPEPLAPPPLP